MQIGKLYYWRDVPTKITSSIIADKISTLTIVEQKNNSSYRNIAPQTVGSYYGNTVLFSLYSYRHWTISDYYTVWYFEYLISSTESNQHLQSRIIFCSVTHTYYGRSVILNRY